MQRIRPRITLDERQPLRRAGGRSGLAPLELVLCLPLLMAVLALIIDLGIEVKWKIRALAVSRQAVWRQRPGRKGATDPRPAGWPTQNATLQVTPATNPPLFPQDPFSQNVVVRGPILRDPNAANPGSQLVVDTNLLDLSGGVERGNARIDRGFPMFPSLPGVHLNVDQILADGQWKSQEMGVPVGDSRGPRDEWRRTRRIYRFIPPGNVTELADKYRQAALAILFFPLRPNLAVLDRDDELIAWYGPPPRDFHPVLRNLGGCTNDPPGLSCTCTLNRFLVHDSVLKELIDHIQGPRGGGRGGVPSVLADAFIRMYEERIGLLMNEVPPNQALIDSLKELVRQLKSFQGSLF